MSFIGYKKGKLHMENVALEQVAEKYGTPVYCYSAEQLADNFHAYQKAMRDIAADDKFTICYACKANSNQAVMRLLGKLGAGADVVSGGEMYRAFHAGIDARKMVFSGVGKTEEELTRAIKNGLLQINVESEPELNLIAAISVKEKKKTNIAIRVNPDVDAKTHAKITTGLSENKFGIDIAAAPALYRKAKDMEGLAPTGVAVHIGSQLTDLAPFEEAFKRIAKLVTDLRAQGNTITTVDLGGGIGIQYKDETTIDLEKYAALIRDIILPLDVHVILEPGRSMVGNAGLLLTRVQFVKEGPTKKFLIVNAGMNDMMRPSMYDAYHPILPCNEAPAKGTMTKYDVVGPVCESSCIFLADAEFPRTEAGSLLSIMASGAYGAAMSSTYNSRPLIPEVLISDDQFDLIRKPQRIEDIVNNDVIPDWLA